MMSASHTAPREKMKFVILAFWLVTAAPRPLPCRHSTVAVSPPSMLRLL
jgi:hypothetical protein